MGPEDLRLRDQMAMFSAKEIVLLQASRLGTSSLRMGGGEDQGDKNILVKGMPTLRDIGSHLRQPGRKIVRNKGTAQKAGEGNGHLNGKPGKRAGWLTSRESRMARRSPLRGQVLQLHIDSWRSRRSQLRRKQRLKRVENGLEQERHGTGFSKN